GGSRGAPAGGWPCRGCSKKPASVSPRRSWNSPTCALRDWPGTKSRPGWGARPRPGGCNWPAPPNGSPRSWGWTMRPTTDPAEAFGRLWSQGRQPDLGAFLAQVGPLPLPQLAEVVRVEQRQRWQAGQPVSAEAFLQQFPDLQADPDLAVDLIFNEFLLREKLGQQPEPEEYLRRFPSHAA